MIDVAGAIIEALDGRILLAQRPQGKHLAGLWEFPGGKLEIGESPEVALHRELYEELRIKVEVRAFIGAFDYAYDWGLIRLHIFVATPLSLPQVTKDVQVFKWQSPEAVAKDWLAPADVAPLEVYLDQFRTTGPVKS